MEENSTFSQSLLGWVQFPEVLLQLCGKLLQRIVFVGLKQIDLVLDEFCVLLFLVFDDGLLFLNYLLLFLVLFVCFDQLHSLFFDQFLLVLGYRNQLFQILLRL